MGHDFLAPLLILLYVGAMGTFFLFTLIILNIKIDPIAEHQFIHFPYIYFTQFALFLSLIYIPIHVSILQLNYSLPFFTLCSQQFIASYTQLYGLAHLLFSP